MWPESHPDEASALPTIISPVKKKNKKIIDFVKISLKIKAFIMKIKIFIPQIT